MDQVQKWCEIRCNYIWLMNLNWHIAYKLRGMYPFTSSLTHLLVGPKKTRGRNCHQGFWMVQTAIDEEDKYLLPSCTGRHSRPGLGRGIIGCFPRVFLLLRRSCCVRCDLLWVTDLCNPCGTILSILHLSSMVLGKTLIQGENQRVQLATNFSPL